MLGMISATSFPEESSTMRSPTVADDGNSVQCLGDGRQLSVVALHEINHGEVQLDEQLPLARDGGARRRRDLPSGENPRRGHELDERLVLREDGREEEMRRGQRRVPAELDLERRRRRPLVSRIKIRERETVRVNGLRC
uniref:Uncharacterized protein n=1 Tax=Arundo donax TaxID=35708 RepID=A0A0A9G251_ARUDO